jgi:hypothetical protein
MTTNFRLFYIVMTASTLMLFCRKGNGYYINQLMYLIKYIQKYKITVKLLHISAPRCHHQGVILAKEYKDNALN